MFVALDSPDGTFQSFSFACRPSKTEMAKSQIGLIGLAVMGQVRPFDIALVLE